MSKRAIGTGLMAEHRALEAPVAHSKGCCLEAHSNLLSLLPKSPFYCLRSSGFQGEDGFYILRKYLLKGQGIALKRGFCFGFFSLVKSPRERVGRPICLFFPSAPLSYPPPPPGSICATAERKTPQFLNQHDLESMHKAVV